MALDPRDINEKKFTEVRFVAGYDQDEVDNFLDQCEASVVELLRDKDDLSRRLSAAEAALAKASAGTSLLGIEKLMTIAQQQADQAVADANHQAASLVAEAQSKADEIVGKAHVEAAGHVDKARADAAAIAYAASTKRDEIDKHAAELTAKRDAVATQLQSALSYLTEGQS